MSELHVGKIVKKIIIELELSQSELSDRLGLSKTAVNMMLKKKSISTHLVEAISLITKVNIFEALGKAYLLSVTNPTITSTEYDQLAKKIELILGKIETNKTQK